LRRNINESMTAKGGAAKAICEMKTLLEGLESGNKWIKRRRSNDALSPVERREADRRRRSMKIGETLVVKYETVPWKVREKRTALLRRLPREREIYNETLSPQDALLKGL